MEKKIKFFFFGFGQTARYFVKELLKTNKKFIFKATNTKKSKILNFDKRKFKSFKFKNDIYDKKILEELQMVDYILISIPPQKKRDLVLENFGKVLINSNIKKIIYLSATSVYGNHRGRWVNENSKLKGKTVFGLARRATEKVWINFRKKYRLDVNILRVSGIYSKENNVLKKIFQKNIYIEEKKYFSRIRIEDLATVIKKTFFSKRKSMILNVSDNRPATNVEVAKYAAQLLKIKKLKAVPISKFKNKMIKAFYKDSKKVSNKNMRTKLKIKLKYPTYQHGLRDIFDNFK
ncbi:MAG: hypothetical protein CBE33_00985 [Candidatus Pelagibacter sp. TMED273]|nr:MAG: hypothetical protein CBE33_00985 [Candidatus Pelagibacter sp. TMED273]|tara:strand:+ start:2895 stop:3767 length:873 start_codon:yes stop_codon:yes gene_type:complete